MGLPEKPLTKEEIIGRLEECAKLDADPYSGKLFTIAFESGSEDLRNLLHRAFTMFMDKNILDITEFRSAIKLEKEIIDMAKSLMNADEDGVGTFTFGGTESVFLAVKAARDSFFIKKGFQMPEIVMPVTGHPCYDKAAEYMGLKVVRVPVDQEILEGDPDAIKEAITDNTAMIVGSVPNWPFGTFDPIEKFAEIAAEKNIWFHVDACVGGFILPFLKKLGESIPVFDFSIPGVSSISMDPHKYAYSSIGSSIILFRKSFNKMLSQYVNLRWPGYPIVNPGVLSSRSAGSLAATWAALHYAGEPGYLDLARKILKARTLVVDNLEKLDFKIMGRPRSPIVAFSSEEVNVFQLSDEMLKKGWFLLPQRGIGELSIPRSIHLTITPIHEQLSKQFALDLEEAKLAVSKMPPSEIGEMAKGFGMIMGLTAGEMDYEALRQIMNKLEGYIDDYGPELLKAFGLEEGLPQEMATLNELFDALPPEITELLVNYVVTEIYRKGL